MKLELGKLKERWTSANQESQATLDDQTFKGLLAEYSVLRSEMHDAQGRRMQITSFAVAAFGAILSITGNIVLGSASMEPAKRLWIAIGGAITIYAMVISSLTIMITTQRAIERLGEYIGIAIEPYVPGLKWERIRYEFEAKHPHKGGLTGPGGIYFFLSILPLLLPIYALSHYTQGWVATLILIPFFILSLYLSCDLRKHESDRLKKWKKHVEEHKTNNGCFQYPNKVTESCGEQKRPPAKLPPQPIICRLFDGIRAQIKKLPKFRKRGKK